MVQQMNELWTEKYRPRTINDYVFRDENQKRQVQKWVEEKDIPHLLLSGVQGTGKTTLGKVILNEIGVDDSDILYINGSLQNSIDDVRNKIINSMHMHNPQPCLIHRRNLEQILR